MKLVNFKIKKGEWCEISLLYNKMKFHHWATSWKQTR